jgi:hypothetical protein
VLLGSKIVVWLTPSRLFIKLVIASQVALTTLTSVTLALVLGALNGEAHHGLGRVVVEEARRVTS